MKAQATGGDGKMGLVWAAATTKTLVVSCDDGDFSVGTVVLGLGRLSPSRVSVGVAWVLL